MDTQEQKILEGLQRLAKGLGPDMLLEGTVTEVDQEAYTADVELDTGGMVFDVRLRAVVSSNHSFDLLPEVGSEVVIARINDEEFFCLACDRISSARITNGQTTVALADKIEISKGDETLQAILSDLIDEILKIYAPKNVPGLKLIQQRFKSLLK